MYVYAYSCAFALMTNQCFGSPEKIISPEVKPWRPLSFWLVSQGLVQAVPSRGRVARRGDGGICEWCFSARGG